MSRTQLPRHLQQTVLILIKERGFIMENFYFCTVKHGNSYNNVLISTDKIFPKQFNKNNLEQFTDLKDMAFQKVIKDTMPFQICPTPEELTFIYYRKTTKEALERAEAWNKFEEDWFASEEYDEEDEWYY